MTDNKWTPQISVTAILERLHQVGPDTTQRQYLILRRSENETNWPGYWTFPGGKITTDDFIGTPTPINNQWYGVAEMACLREIREETGIVPDAITRLQFLTNIAIPNRFIMSYVGYMHPKFDGRVKVDGNEIVDYKWVTVSEASKHQLIDGLLQEIYNAAKLLKSYKLEYSCPSLQL